MSQSDTQGEAIPRPVYLRPLIALLDALWLGALMVYALAGAALVPFHGDESMQIYASRDFATAFIHGQPGQLMTAPPYPIDSDQHLRLINGSINRHTIGLAWMLAGMTEADLPAIWFWGLSYEENLARGARPADELLAVARLPASTFLALSIAVIFALGRLFGGRPAAYFASVAYGLHPVILLNGRHATQEGAFLFFGLLAVLTAAVISRRREMGRGVGRWLAGLGIASGLALASKHSSAVFVASAYGWVLATEAIRSQVRGKGLKPLVQHLSDRPVMRQVGVLALSAIAAVLLFMALSPALWYNPPARLRDLAAARRELLTMQVEVEPLAPTSGTDRLRAILEEPFLRPPQYFEASFWAGFDPITGEIARYESSGLAGLRLPAMVGMVLTVLGIFGLIALLAPQLRLQRPTAPAAGLMTWIAVTFASLLANPLPWQRYALHWLPVVILLAGIGLAAILRAARAGRI